MGTRSALLAAWIAGLMSSGGAATNASGGEPRLLIPADAGQKFSRHGGVLVLKVGPQNSGATQLFIGTMELPAGGVIPTHRHDRDEEVLYVVDGEVDVVLNDRQLRATRGDTVFVPVGTWMTVRNNGANLARLLGIFARAEMETCMRLLQAQGAPPGHDSAAEAIPAVCHMSVPQPESRAK